MSKEWGPGKCKECNKIISYYELYNDKLCKKCSIKINNKITIPCPFCGKHKIELLKPTAGYYILCRNCGMQTGKFELRETVIKFWNKRKEDSRK